MLALCTLVTVLFALSHFFGISSAASYEVQASHFVGTMVYDPNGTDPKVLKAVIANGLGGLRHAVRILGRISRRIGDTFANIANHWLLKPVGVAVQAIGFQIKSIYLTVNRAKGPHERMPSYFRLLARQHFSPPLYGLASIFNEVGETIVSAGDEFQIICSTSGQNLEDAFSFIDEILFSLQKFFSSLLLIEPKFAPQRTPSADSTNTSNKEKGIDLSILTNSNFHCNLNSLENRCNPGGVQIFNSSNNFFIHDFMQLFDSQSFSLNLGVLYVSYFWGKSPIGSIGYRVDIPVNFFFTILVCGMLTTSIASSVFRLKFGKRRMLIIIIFSIGIVFLWIDREIVLRIFHQLISFFPASSIKSVLSILLSVWLEWICSPYGDIGKHSHSFSSSILANTNAVYISHIYACVFVCVFVCVRARSFNLCR